MPSVKAILRGDQSCTIFKDTRELAKVVAGTVDALVSGGEVQVNDTKSYNNGVKVVPSYLIESAVYNVPNDCFDPDTWTERIRRVLTHIYLGTEDDDCVQSDDWLEVNCCKFLFFNGQAWSRETANDFALQAWRYVGLGS